MVVPAKEAMEDKVLFGSATMGALQALLFSAHVFFTRRDLKETVKQQVVSGRRSDWPVTCCCDAYSSSLTELLLLQKQGSGCGAALGELS